MSALAEPWMDELEARLGVAARRVSARLSARRRRRRLAATALAATLLVGGAALAETTPFHPLAAFQGIVGAQRGVRPDDRVPAAFRAQFAHHIGGLELDQFRLMAKLPGERRMSAAPGRGGTLCLIVTLSADSGVSACGPRLGPAVPLTATISTAHEGAGPILAGLARDDVRAILFTAGGVPLRIPVRNNAFFYEGRPFTGIKFAFVAELRDGGAVAYPRS